MSVFIGSNKPTKFYIGSQTVSRLYFGGNLVWPTYYTISVTASPSAAGSVTGGGTYQEGSSVTLNATVNSGYVFAGWKEGNTVVSTSSPYTFTATANRTITCEFVAIPTYTITAIVSPTGAGTVSGTGTYQQGNRVTLTASTNSGYRFSGWKEGSNTVSTQNPYTFTAKSNRTITAVFVAIPTYTITAIVSPSGAGTVTGAGSYREGQTVTLTATMNDGYKFTGWQENGTTVSTSNPYSFTANSNRSFTALLKSSEVTYDGTITPLSVARYDLAATTVGNYALFGGGDYQSGNEKVVDAYNSSLTKTWVQELDRKKVAPAATTVGNYALFGGGKAEPNSDYDSLVVIAYSSSLIRTSAPDLSVARSDLAATTVGDYALFGGGFLTGVSSGSLSYDNVDAYSTSLTRSTVTPLNLARGMIKATTVGNFAIFGGNANIAEVYNSTLTKTSVVNMTLRYNLAATTVGGYALFGGGDISADDQTSLIEAYNESLTRSTPTPLSSARSLLAATKTGNYALFCCGQYHNLKMPTTDAYDSSLTRSRPGNLVAAIRLAATNVGNYALFGGGMTEDSSKANTVFAFKS